MSAIEKQLADALHQAKIYVEADETAHGRSFGTGNAIRAALAAYDALQGDGERPPNTIPMPRDLDEARAMVLLGEATLRGAGALQPQGDGLAELREALGELGRASANYRHTYEKLGGSDILTGMAWDALRKAEDKALAIYAKSAPPAAELERGR